MRKSFIALLGVILIAVATLMQMMVDWYQSYALGVPQPSLVKFLVVAAGILTFLALILSLMASSRRPTSP